MKFINLIIILIIILGTNLLSTTYYVDNTHLNSSDTNDGTDPNFPWETIGHVNDYSEDPGFNAGDQILLKRGDIWNEGIDFSNSLSYGTNDDHIIIGAYGGGNRPILDGNNLQSCGVYLEKKFFEIVDLEILNFYSEGIRIHAPQKNTGTIINNVYVHDITTTIPANILFVFGIKIESNSCTITNSTVSNNINDGIFIDGDACIISNNEIIDNGIGGTVSDYLGDAIQYIGDNGSIYNNHIKNYITDNHLYTKNCVRFEGDVVEIYDNFCESAGFGIGVALATNVKVRNNYFYNIRDDAIQIKNGEFFNNIVYECLNGGIRCVGDNTSFEIKIFGNTIVDCKKSLTIDGGIIDFRNNLLYYYNLSNPRVLKILSQSNISNLDFNLYYPDNVSNMFYLNGSYYSSLINWQSSGNDGNSLSSDPILSFYPAIPLFFLSEYSPAINLATDLGSAYDFDYKYWIRSSDNVWDIGAQEYIPSTFPKLRPRFNLEDYSLSQNYPNPFNPATLISFSIPNDEFVSLRIYDVLGREFAQIINERRRAGTYQIEFNGAALNSGVYYYTLTAGSYTETKKMMIIK